MKRKKEKGERKKRGKEETGEEEDKGMARRRKRDISIKYCFKRM